jgi:hypothetical protein
MQKFYQVKNGRVIRVSGITFQQGARLWLNEQEFLQHKDSVELLYPPSEETPTP